MKKISADKAGLLGWSVACFLVLTATILLLINLIDFAHAADPTPSQDAVKASPTTSLTETAKSSMTPEERIETIERILQSVKITGEKAEERSYQNKMMARELIYYVKVMVVILIVIAVGFPFSMWLLSNKRILGLSGFSNELAATLVTIEERQAKLANILKDVQNEIDYLHTMSVPDLKNLIQQAEKYLAQNEQDLEKTKYIKDRNKQH